MKKFRVRVFSCIILSLVLCFILSSLVLAQTDPCPNPESDKPDCYDGSEKQLKTVYLDIKILGKTGEDVVLLPAIDANEVRNDVDRANNIWQYAGIEFIIKNDHISSILEDGLWNIQGVEGDDKVFDSLLDSLFAKNMDNTCIHIYYVNYIDTGSSGVPGITAHPCSPTTPGGYTGIAISGCYENKEEKTFYKRPNTLAHELGHMLLCLPIEGDDPHDVPICNIMYFAPHVSKEILENRRCLAEEQICRARTYEKLQDEIGLGNVGGEVLDEDNHSVENATISLFNNKGYFSLPQIPVKSDATNGIGMFAILDVPFGDYYIEVSKQGYQKLIYPQDEDICSKFFNIAEFTRVFKIQPLQHCFYKTPIPLQVNQPAIEGFVCQSYYQRYKFDLNKNGNAYIITVTPYGSGNLFLYYSDTLDRLNPLDAPHWTDCSNAYECSSDRRFQEGAKKVITFSAPDTGGDPNSVYIAVYGVTDVDYSIQVTSSPLIVTQGITLSPSSPYYVGNPLTSEFTIKNTSINDVEIEELLLKGQGPEGNDDIWNFEPVENLILPAGGEYHYQASLQNGQFTKSGQYDFEVGYYKDGEWFRIPVDPEQPEIENEVSIYVRPRWKAVTQRACYNEDNLEGTPLLDTNGNKWYELDFEPPSSWNYTRLPENNTFGSGWDRFFRYEFNLASATVVNKTVFASDDGLWLWINGQYINHWGANCGGSRCVNDPTGRCANNTNVDPVELVNLQAGKNVIAIRVNNGACCHSYFDAQVSASLLEEALAGLNPLMRGNIIEVWDFNPGQIRNRYYSVDYVQNIQAILNFQGSTLRLNVYRPNGTLYNSWQSSIPPINITIPNAEVGTWRFEIRAVSVPHNNYLCTLVIADETSFETSAGQYVEVFPLQELSLKFSQVDTAGCTTASRSDSGTAINGKYQILSEPIYYQMETDATFHGEVDICIFYDENIIGQANEADLMLLQNINGVWENVSISLDQISNIICGTTTQLGEFALVAGIEQIIPVISLEMNLPAGWSMISLPVKPQDTKLSALFPKAEVVYSYEKDAGYLRVPNNKDLEVGKGYWILSYEDQNSVLTGQSIPSYADAVSEDGWTMIGGCSSDAKISTTGCKIGVIYKYALGSGYQRVPTSEVLEPCHGYWILFQDVVGQCQFAVEKTGD